MDFVVGLVLGAAVATAYLKGKITAGGVTETVSNIWTTVTGWFKRSA